MIGRLIISACLLLLGACASQAPLPASAPHLKLPMQLHVVREQAGQRQDWILVIQQQTPGLRWSMMDPLGIPVARQLLIDGQWKADGLLPPNPQAKELFAALLFALTPARELQRNYPMALAQANQRDLGKRWHVHYSQTAIFDLRTEQNVTYRISPLNDEVSP